MNRLGEDFTHTYGDFEQILETVGNNGRYQVMITIITSLAFIPHGLAALAAVFEAASPEFWCVVPGLADHTVDQLRQLGVPPGPDACRVSDFNSSFLPNNGSSPNETSDVDCRHFIYDTSSYASTIVTKWDLVCSRMLMKPLSTSLFMLGQVIGVLVFGHLADHIGRRLAWFISVWVTLLSGAAAAFVPNYWAYVILRMMSAASTLGGCVCTYTLGMEVVGVNHRKMVYLLPNGVFGVGMMLLSFVAYFIRDYAWLQLTISSMTLPLLATYWILGESPRWQLRTGRIEEAEKEIQRIARINKRTIPPDLLSMLNPTLLETTHIKEEKHSLLDLLRSPNIRRKTLITWFVWFAISLVYFGISLGSNNLGGSAHVNLCIAGAVDMLGPVGIYLILDKVARRLMLVISFFVCGIFCILLVLVPPEPVWLTIILSTIGRVGVVVAFDMVYVHAVEFYPTVVRGIGLGSASMCARVGSILAPFVADLGYLAWGPLPQVAFASLSLIAGSLCFFLPETRYQKLPETLQECEQFARNRPLHVCGRTAIDHEEECRDEDRLSNGHGVKTTV